MDNIRIRDLVSKIEIRARVIKDMNEQADNHRWLKTDVDTILSLCEGINTTVLEVRDKIENLKTNL